LLVTQVWSPADLKRLRYTPLRHHRPELPEWLDAVLQKALHQQPAKRQEALSEFVHDLHAPGPQFQRKRAPPLVEKHPVAFWQVTSLVLGLAVVLLGLRVYGH
jgi:hypothetical protein